MVRTQGEGSQSNRVRPTTSVRHRDRGGPSNIVEEEANIE